ncbi:MAG: chaperone modulator CbpM [Burkholderiales bacterium]
MKSVTVYTTLLVDHDAPVTIDELARCCERQTEWVVTLVREGVVSIARGEEPREWAFGSLAVARARQIARLQRDFDVNLDAAALMIDLMEEVRQLRRRLGS